MALTREDCRTYLESLEMAEELVERGLQTAAAIRSLFPLELEHIFVSDLRDEEGERSFTNMWLIGPGLMSEAHRFATGPGFDIARVDEGIARLVIDPCYFDFAAASEESRLHVTINFGPGGNPLTGEMRATGRNCLVLQGIVERYLTPLLLDPGRAAAGRR